MLAAVGNVGVDRRYSAGTVRVRVRVRVRVPVLFIEFI